MTFFYVLSFKNDVNVPSKRNGQKNLEKNQFFVGILKVNYETPDPLVRAIDPQIRIRTKMSWIRNIAFKYLTFMKKGFIK